MKVAILSDLHIGCPPVPGAFGHPPRAFADYLARLLDTHDQLVLNGDIFQSDHQLIPGITSQRAAIARAVDANPWLHDVLELDQTTLLRGNHDDETQRVLGAGVRHMVDGPVGRLVVTHGDVHDPVIGTAPGISALATWSSGRIRRIGLGRLAQWLEGRDIAIKGARFSGPAGAYARGAAVELAQHNAQVVVFGHTHQPALLTLAPGIYANPGSASLGHRAHVSVDLSEGRLHVEVDGRVWGEERLDAVR